MILRVYSVYDAATEAFNGPFYMPALGAALRGFTDLVNSPDQQFYKHPEDFTLFELGTWDDASASFTLHKAPKPVISALEAKDTDIDTQKPINAN